MTEQALVQKINSFSQWHYQFNLNGHLTPISEERWINRHLQRGKYFFEPLIHLFGGSLKDQRVLDLGCNAGFWSLQAVNNGGEFVLGIDGRQMHIDQANLVFEVNHIAKERYKFIRGNIFDLDFARFGTFQIVLCLGLMYHISKPIELLEKIAHVNTDILIIDTRISTIEGSLFEMYHENLDDPRNAIDYNIAFIPTKKAIFDIMPQFGYSVIMLKPRFTDYTGAHQYEKGTRRAFLCAKKTDLSILPVDVEEMT